MPTKAGQIIIELDAGTAKFVQQMAKAKTTMHEFGEAGVSETKATAAGMKLIEGHLLTNSKAMDSFIEKTLGLGNVMKVAFPAVGALAFGAVMIELGTKVYDFFKQLKDGPEKAKGQWSTLTETLHKSNAELDLTYAKLQQDLNALEGKRTNNLVIALEEARVAAMNLGQEFGKTLDSMYKLFKEQDGNWFTKMFGAADNSPLMKLLGGGSGYGGIGEGLRKINQDEDQQLQAIDPKAKDAKKQYDDILDANIKLRIQLAKPLTDAIADRLAVAQRLSKNHKEITPGSSSYGGYIPAMTVDVAGSGQEANNAEVLTEGQSNLKAAIERMNTAHRVYDVSAQISDRQFANANQKQDAPYNDELIRLKAQAAGIQQELAAVGKGHEFQIIAKSAFEAGEEIAKINIKLKEMHQAALNPAQVKTLQALFKGNAEGQDQVAWGTKIDATLKKLKDETDQQKALAAAIGQGYEAVKKASIEATVVKEMTPERYDPDSAEAANIRRGANSAYDATHQTQVRTTLQSLSEQSDLENALAAAQMKGAEAVRQTELNYKLLNIAMHNDIGSAWALEAAEISLYNAKRLNASDEEIHKLNEEATALDKVAAAASRGAEAMRLAKLQAKYDQMKDNGVSPNVIDATKAKDESEHQDELIIAANKLATATEDRLTALAQTISLLKQQEDITGKTLGAELAIKAAQEEQLHLIIEQDKALGTAKGALDAFFLEMELDSKRAGDVLYEALHSALDKTSDQLANLLTGKKTNFAKMFQDIGHQMIAGEIKKSLEGGLTKLAHTNGPVGKLLEKLGIGKVKPTGSNDNPFYVFVKNWPNDGTGTGTLSPTTEGPDGRPSILQGAPPAGGLLSSVAGLFSHGDVGGPIPDVSSSISFAAEGADNVSPGQRYWVGDGGEAELFSPKTAGSITPLSKLGGGVNYQIDARGSALGVESRIAAGIQASHNSAIAKSVQATQQRKNRTPHRKAA